MNQAVLAISYEICLLPFKDKKMYFVLVCQMSLYAYLAATDLHLCSLVLMVTLRD